MHLGKKWLQISDADDLTSKKVSLYHLMQWKDDDAVVVPVGAVITLATGHYKSYEPIGPPFGARCWQPTGLMMPVGPRLGAIKF